MHKELKDLKVGDTVIHITRNYKRVYPITRLTKNYIICDQGTFRKDNGRPKGGYDWCISYILAPTEGYLEEVLIDQRKRLISNKLQYILDNSDRLPNDMDKLKEILTAVDKIQKELGE